MCPLGGCVAIPSVADELKALTVLYDCGTQEFLKMHRINMFSNKYAAMDNIAIAKYLIEKGHDISSIAGIVKLCMGKDSWKDFSVYKKTVT